jgi:PKD repeat protein
MKSSLATFVIVALTLLLGSMLNIVLAEEPSLQEWFTNNSYVTNVGTDETGIETFTPGNYRVTLLAEMGLYAPNNTFGWYSTTAGTFHELFSGENTPNNTVEFSSTERFALYLGSLEGTFHSENTRNLDEFDHAWVFLDPKTIDGYIIAWEDLLNGGDEDYQDMIIAIRALRSPCAVFNWFPQHPQVNEEIVFNASDSTPDGGYVVSYKWNFGDDNITTIDIPVITHVYYTSGNYTVRLNVTDSEGKWDLESKTITVQRLIPESQFAVKIEGEWTLVGDKYEFTAPTYCKTFKVEVQIINVLDLFGYEFWIEFDPDLIQVTEYEIKHVHTEDTVTLEEVDNTAGVYKQAVKVKPPAETYNGSAPVANLWFHILKDPCYPYNYTSMLKLNNTRMTDSHESPIFHTLKHGYFNILSVRPALSIEHEGEIETTIWMVNETFTLHIPIINIIKMKNFFIELGWCHGLETDYQNVQVTGFLPQPYMVQELNINNTVLTVQIETFIEKPAINGTGAILRVTFKASNPWSSVPPYTLVDDKYLPENYTCKISIINGWIDVFCPDYRKMDLYDASYGVEVKNNFTYTFTPIPGDLNLDGEVDIIDLSTISRWTGFESGDPEWADCCCFDLNGDGGIDIFDIVIVATNLGRINP